MGPSRSICDSYLFCTKRNRTPPAKLDVDTQEDLDKIRYLCVGLDKESSAQNIINIYKKEFGL